MTSKKRRFVIIDANSVIHRSFHALPPLTTKNGELVNAVYGFLLVFFKAVREFRPEFIAVCFDYPAPTFRHKEFKEYKAKRPPTPKGLCEQIPKLKEVLRVLSVPVFEKEGFEADDLIGTIVEKSKEKKGQHEIENIIISGDLDTLQLVDKNTKVYFLKKGVKDTVLYGEELIRERYSGMSPDLIVDFKALRGDPSDNIPGVSGVGEKTAIQLLLEFGSLELLYKEIEKGTDRTEKIKPKLRDLLIKNKKQAFFSRSLAMIERNVPINFNLEKCKWGGYNKREVENVLKSLEFNSLLKRLPEFQKSKSNGKIREVKAEPQKTQQKTLFDS